MEGRPTRPGFDLTFCEISHATVSIPDSSPLAASEFVLLPLMFVWLDVLSLRSDALVFVKLPAK